MVYFCDASAYGYSRDHVYESHSLELETYLDARGLLMFDVVMLISCAEGSLTEAMTLLEQFSAVEREIEWILCTQIKRRKYGERR